MKIKNTKAIVVAVLGLATAGVVSFNAFARPSYGYETTYYSDASRTDVVGSRELTCSGHSFGSGSVTSFYDTITFKCN